MFEASRRVFSLSEHSIAQQNQNHCSRIVHRRRAGAPLEEGPALYAAELVVEEARAAASTGGQADAACAVAAAGPLVHCSRAHLALAHTRVGSRPTCEMA